MTPEELQKFCSHDETRYGLEAPFSQGNRTHATNGHIAISVPRIAGVHDQDKPDMDSVYVLVDVDDPERLWVLPPEPVFTVVKCASCGGSGFVRDCGCDSGCRKCDGEIIVAAEKGSKNAEPCEFCDSGEIRSGSVLVAGSKGETRLASEYIELIRTLPCAEIGLIGTESDWGKKRTQKDNPPVCIRFDGGFGLLMPVRK